MLSKEEVKGGCAGIATLVFIFVVFGVVGYFVIHYLFVIGAL